jgi:putative addiction module antidote
MTKLVKIIQVGDSLGVILPPDVLEQLSVTVGDSVEIAETLDGILISNADE